MRRPALRSLAGGAAGIGIGVIAGVILTASSAAGPSPPAPPRLIEAAHVPPVLTLPGEPVRLRYAIVCTPREGGEPCDGSGTVYVRARGEEDFRPLPLRRGRDSNEGRYYADVSAPGGFSYYAVLRDDATGANVRVPSGGGDAPQVSVRLADAVRVSLGRHVFRRIREPDARVAEATWGSAPHDVGLGGSRELGFAGPSSFDVEPDGTVDVLDSVNERVMRWTRGRREVVSLPGTTELSDFAAEANGDYDVLDVRGILHRFAHDGTPRWTQKLSDRTWAKLDRGAVVLQQPSEQWMPVADHGAPLARAEQARGSQTRHRGVLVERVGQSELRIALGSRAWVVTSDTPLGEVQLAEPHGEGVVVVTRVYTDDRDEFLVLLLGHDGVDASFAAASESWTETAPLARFRLARNALYRFRTTERGVAVDRFELEVPQ